MKSYTQKMFREFLPLTLIFALAIFLRTFNLFNTTGIMSDSGRDLLVAKHLASATAPFSVSPTLTSSTLLLKNSPLYFLFLGLMWLIAPSVQGVVLFFALIQACVAIVAYFLGKKMHGKNVGYFLAFYVSVSPHFIDLGRWVWQMNLFGLLIPLLLLIFFHIAPRNQNTFWPYATFFFVANICLHFHFSTTLLVLAMFFWLIKKTLHDPKTHAWVVYAVAISFLLRLIVGLNVNGIAASHLHISDFFPSPQLVVRTLGEIKESFHVSVFKGAGEEFAPYLALVVGFILLTGAFAFYKEQLDDQFRKYVLALCVLMATCLGYIFYWDYAHEYHYLPFALIFQLLIAAVLAYMILITKKFKIIGLFLALSLLFLYFLSDSDIIFYWQRKEIHILDAVAERISSDAKNDHVVFSISLANPIYGPANIQSSFNAALWLFLEKKLNQELITIRNEQPIVVEPTNPVILYQVTLDETYYDQYSIQKIRLQ